MKHTVPGTGPCCDHITVPRYLVLRLYIGLTDRGGSVGRQYLLFRAFFAVNCCLQTGLNLVLFDIVLEKVDKVMALNYQSSILINCII